MNGPPLPLRTSAALGLLGLALFFGLWWFLTAAGLVPQRFLPTPFDVGGRFLQLLTSPFAGSTLPVHLLSSLQRYATGVLLAAIIGVPLGLLMGWFRLLDDIITPIFDGLRFIAPIAWVPFAALWFGTGIGGPVMIIFAGAFPPCLINAYRGARFVEPRLIEAARMLGTETCAPSSRSCCRRRCRLDHRGPARLGRPRLAEPRWRGADRRGGRRRLHDGAGAGLRADRDRDDRHAGDRARRHADRRGAPAGRSLAPPRVVWRPNVGSIRFENVNKMFGGSVTALQDINLTIAEKEFVAIVGPSGCGKTTCLRMVAGFEAPTSGVVSVNGREVTAPGPDRAVVFQQFALFPWKTVRQNIDLGLRNKNLPQAERDGIIAAR